MLLGGRYRPLEEVNSLLVVRMLLRSFKDLLVASLLLVAMAST